MSYNPNFSGIQGTASLSTSETNNTGSTLSKLTPVRIAADGQIATIDVSVEAQALAIAGIVKDDISNSGSGTIINTGRIEDITTAGTFGDILYVSKTGGVTHIKPSIGVDSFVAGDFVIRLGIVTKNTSNPLNKDLIVNILIVGQL